MSAANVNKLLDLLLAEGRITQQVVDQMRTWQHSGFSVDKSVFLPAGDTAVIERLTQYIVRCPFSLDRILSLNPDGKVVYRAEKAECRPFPALGDQNLRQGVKRNFEVSDPLELPLRFAPLRPCRPPVGVVGRRPEAG